MANTPLEPWTNAMRLDESSRLRSHRYADRFSVVRVETTGPLLDAIHKSSSVPALLLSLFVKPVAAADYRLWFADKLIPTGRILASHANVVDLAGGPAMWGARGIDHVHFHVRHGVIDDTAATLGFERVGNFRPSIAGEDIVLAQLTRSVLPFLAPGSAPSPLALDQLELVVAAHVIQRYGSARRRRQRAGCRLAPWQSQRATELLRENLGGRIGLSDVANACDLSVSHFARSFKATFGVSCHRWLTERRIECAQTQLMKTSTPLVEIAIQAGFADQPAFTRTFRHVVGVTPGRWRREHRRR
ncbi:MAG TPA: AraC family transcriptional regulator [Polyangiaceae bacterium]|jgi:AraC family transcriptional regulator|nr:AraC family transcriptional regulator [Polyangiaceae bacterium]